MSRAALLTLLFSFLLNISLHAQRSVGMAPARASSSPAHAAVNGPRTLRGSAPLHGVHQHGTGEPHNHNHRFGVVGFPYYPFDYDEYGTEPNTTAEVQNGATRTAPEREERLVKENPIPSAQVIEIPGALNARTAAPLPPTVFILLSGEKLEAQQFLLTATDLSVTMHRTKRTIALDMLDLDATVAANHDRGIELRIPNDRNEISLRF